MNMRSLLQRSKIPGFHGIKEAIDLTVRECIEENILRDFLEQHRREVCDMCLTEFDEKKYEDVLREEGREEGLAEGRSEERKTLLEIVQKLKEGKLRNS